MVSVQIQKKDLWFLSAIMIFLIGAGYVIAWGSENPVLHGHDASEIVGGGGTIQSVQVVGNTNIQSTCNWLDMDDMIIILDTNGGDILLVFSASVESWENSAYGYLRLLVDGAPVHNVLLHGGNQGIETFSMNWIEKDLAAGTHTFKIQWKGTPGPVFNPCYEAIQSGAAYPRVFNAIELN